MDITGSDGFFEAVSPDGKLYRVPRSQAQLFARLVGVKHDQNFPRVMDINDGQHQFGRVAL